jgi:hypothetical protein
MNRPHDALESYPSDDILMPPNFDLVVSVFFFFECLTRRGYQRAFSLLKARGEEEDSDADSDTITISGTRSRANPSVYDYDEASERRSMGGTCCVCVCVCV